MQSTGSKLILALAAALGVNLTGSVSAHDGHEHAGAAHGGVSATTSQHHAEAVFTPQGVRLFVHDLQHRPVDLSRVAAAATFYHPNLPDKPWFSRPLRAAPSHPGHPAESLELAIDLRKVPAEGAKVAFRLEGLADSAEPTATFTVPFAFAKAAEIALTKATEADRAAIGALKLCPVSGEDLGSMGGPLKVSRGDQATFICCKGCLEPIQADPDKYLSGGVKPGAAAEHDHQHHE